MKGQEKFKVRGRRRRKHEKSQGGAGVSDEMIAGVISIA